MTGFGIKAALLQAVAVAALFALLVAAPLPEDFFRDWGALTGPAAWIVCGLLTGRVVGMRTRASLAVVAASGAAAGAVGLLVDHGLGLATGIAAFGAAAAVAASRGGGNRTPDLRLERPAS